MVREHRIIKNRDDEATLMTVSKPVDLSCKQLERMDTIPLEAARSGRIGGMPIRQSFLKKYLSRSVWFNNNHFTSIQNLDVCVGSLLEHPEQLGWLDLSYNYIKHIDACILKFPNLKILYLHGNCIREIGEVKKLQALKKLRSLTLHGNPASNLPFYRGFVMGMMPQLVTLDFVPILKNEKLEAKPPLLVKLISKEKSQAAKT